MLVPFSRLHSLALASFSNTAFHETTDSTSRRRARPPSLARTTPDTRSRTRFRLDVHATLAPALRLARDTPGGACIRLTDGHIPAKGREMPVSVTPTLAPREADDTAVCARASLAGLSGHEYRPNQRLPRLVTAGVASAMDPRGGLRSQRSVVGVIIAFPDITVAIPFALDARVARRPGAPGVDLRARDDLRGRDRPGLRSRTRQGLSKTDADDERRWCRALLYSDRKTGSVRGRHLAQMLSWESHNIY